MLVLLLYSPMDPAHLSRWEEVGHGGLHVVPSPVVLVLEARQVDEHGWCRAHVVGSQTLSIEQAPLSGGGRAAQNCERVKEWRILMEMGGLVLMVGQQGGGMVEDC